MSLTQEHDERICLPGGRPELERRQKHEGERTSWSFTPLTLKNNMDVLGPIGIIEVVQHYERF